MASEGWVERGSGVTSGDREKESVPDSHVDISTHRSSRWQDLLWGFVWGVYEEDTQDYFD